MVILGEILEHLKFPITLLKTGQIKCPVKTQATDWNLKLRMKSLKLVENDNSGENN